MPKHFENKVMPYTANQMFDLVSDIENYASFLPWCAGARIKTENEVENKIVITSLQIRSIITIYLNLFLSRYLYISNYKKVLIKYC